MAPEVVVQEGLYVFYLDEIVDLLVERRKLRDGARRKIDLPHFY